MTEDELMDLQPLPDTLPAEEDGSEAFEALARSLEEEPSADEAERSVPDQSVPQELPFAVEPEEPGEPEPTEALVDEASAPLEPVEVPDVEVPDVEVPEVEVPEVEVPDAESSEPEELVERGTRVAWWPFIVYGVLWIGLAGSSYVLLTGTQVDLPAFRQDSYPYLVLAGLVLTLLGPLIALAVWLFAWFKAKKPERGGMLTAALVRGSIVTFLGVVVWWGVLVLVDALRLGLV